MADTPNQTTIIGRDTAVNGEITFESTAQVLGRIQGKIVGKGELRVADGATCRAAIDAGKVTIDGAVEGDVAAKERVELTAKARGQGDIVAPKLIVAEGASFVGHCRIGADAAKGAPAATVAEPKPESKPELKPEPVRSR